MNTFPVGNIVIFDYETTGLSPYTGARPFIAGMEDLQGNVRFYRPEEANWAEFKRIVEDPKIEKVAHGAKFEIKHTKHLGFAPAGKFHDTMALSVLINEYQPINLEALSKTFFKDEYKDMVQKWLKANTRAFLKEYGREPNYSDVPKEMLEFYLEKDLDSTLKLFTMWQGYVKKFFPYLYEVETELAWQVVKMEDRGILIDIPYCARRITELRAMQKKLEQELYTAAGVTFNLASPKQVGQVLVALGAATYETSTNKKGETVQKVDTSYDTLKLQMTRHPFISAFITWRTLAKMIDTYLVPFTQKSLDGVLHPSFWQYGKDKAIVTGRFSATDPNMQNIPKGIRGDKDALHALGDVVRSAVIPRPGYALMFFDFKQIEMVIFTCATKDKALIQAVKNGEDAYTANAKRFYGPHVFDSLTPAEKKKKRYDSKELTLSLIYGMGVRKFALKVGKTMQEARAMKNKYFTEMPKAREFIMWCQTQVLTQGYVQDIFGRKYHVPTAMAYKAVNAYCQGTAATIMKRAILKSVALEKYDTHPIITVHDELIMEVPIKNVDIVAREGKKLFEEWHLLPAPVRLDVDISYTNWAEKKGYDFTQKAG